MVFYDKEKLLSHITETELKKVLDIVVDKVFKVLKEHTTEVTYFLDPYQQLKATEILQGIREVNYKFSGGFNISERKRLVICPSYKEIEEEDFEISYLQIKGNFKFDSISHRDILGAILSLGIKRELLGDIFLDEENILCAVDKNAIDFIRLNLDKVKRTRVTVKELSKKDFKEPQKKLKKERTTVASLRLDAVISSAFNLSRNDASLLIKKEAVKHNYKVTTNNSSKVEKGDIISVRGKGKIEILEIEGETRKKRVPVTFGKYI